jgi:hypothetical protein
VRPLFAQLRARRGESRFRKRGWRYQIERECSFREVIHENIDLRFSGLKVVWFFGRFTLWLGGE